VQRFAHLKYEGRGSMINSHRHLSYLLGVFASSLGFLMSAPGVANAQPAGADGTTPALSVNVGPGSVFDGTNADILLVPPKRSLDSASARLRQSEQRDGSWIGRHTVLFGTLAGFGGGFLLAYAADQPARASHSMTFDVQANAVILGGIGAGAGALVGAIVTTSRETAPSQWPMITKASDREVMPILRAPSLSMGEHLLAQQPGPQNRGWIGRHPALFGSLVGAGAGMAYSNTADNEWFCNGSDDDCLFYTVGKTTLVGAGVGAGVGALVGWLVGLGTK
jgi:hypothetical protein